jgi:hypothetical protein
MFAVKRLIHSLRKSMALIFLYSPVRETDLMLDRWIGETWSFCPLMSSKTFRIVP